MLLISEDLDEIRALSDRIVVIYEGELTGEFDPERRRRSRRSGSRWPAASASVIAIERRLEQPRWLASRSRSGRSPSPSGVMAVVLVDHRARSDRHLPAALQRRVRRHRGLDDTLTPATPLALHRPRGGGRVPDAALQHRRRGPALHRRALRLGRRDLARARTTDSARRSSLMCVCGAAGGALWALIAGVLKAFARTNEIITTLMLNYVAGLLLTYLIFDSASPWRDVSTIQTRSFPQSIALKPSQFWPTAIAGQARRPLRVPARDRDRRRAVRPLPADAVRVRDERDRRLARGPRATRACARGGRSSR